MYPSKKAWPLFMWQQVLSRINKAKFKVISTFLKLTKGIRPQDYTDLWLDDSFWSRVWVLNNAAFPLHGIQTLEQGDQKLLMKFQTSASCSKNFENRRSFSLRNKTFLSSLWNWFTPDSSTSAPAIRPYNYMLKCSFEICKLHSGGESRNFINSPGVLHPIVTFLTTSFSLNKRGETASDSDNIFL